LKIQTVASGVKQQWCLVLGNSTVVCLTTTIASNYSFSKMVFYYKTE